MAKSSSVKHTILYADSLHSIAIKILKKYDRPMSVAEITKKIQQIKKLNTTTPEKSISSILQRSGHIEPSGRGFYRLKRK